MCEKCQLQYCTDCIDTHTCDNVTVLYFGNCVMLCTQVAHPDFCTSWTIDQKEGHVLLRVDIWGCDHRCSWLSAFCMMSYVEGRYLAFVFICGSSGDLKLGAF